MRGREEREVGGRRETEKVLKLLIILKRDQHVLHDSVLRHSHVWG